MSHVRNNYGPQGVFKDHRRDRYGQLAIGIVTSRPRIVFPTWEVHRVSSETMNPWNSVRGFHGMPCARETLGLRGWNRGSLDIFPTIQNLSLLCLSLISIAKSRDSKNYFNFDIRCNFVILTDSVRKSEF